MCFAIRLADQELFDVLIFTMYFPTGNMTKRFDLVVKAMPEWLERVLSELINGACQLATPT